MDRHFRFTADDSMFFRCLPQNFVKYWKLIILKISIVPILRNIRRDYADENKPDTNKTGNKLIENVLEWIDKWQSIEIKI